MGIYIFTVVAPLVDDIGTALEGISYGIDDAVSTVGYFKDFIFTAKVSLNFFLLCQWKSKYYWYFSTLYDIAGGYSIALAVINLLKIVLVTFVYIDIKKEETKKKKKVENQIGDKWAVPTHQFGDKWAAPGTF